MVHSPSTALTETPTRESTDVGYGKTNKPRDNPITNEAINRRSVNHAPPLQIDWDAHFTGTRATQTKRKARPRLNSWNPPRGGNGRSCALRKHSRGRGDGGRRPPYQEEHELGEEAVGGGSPVARVGEAARAHEGEHPLHLLELQQRLHYCRGRA
jgi:hypothetical protein